MNKAFNEVAFLSLSKENQDKVECIYHIAHMLYMHQAPRLTTEEFDALYDRSVRELRAVSGYMGEIPDLSLAKR